MRAYVSAAVLVLVYGVLPSCKPALDPAAYAAELELCLQTSDTCEAYVSCRKAVATKYGRAYEASCE